MTRRALAATLAFATFGGAALAEGVLPYQDAPRVANGEVVYQDYCASCHGANLEGQVREWRVPDADGYLPAPPHDRTGHTWHHTDALLIRIVTEGTEAIVGGTYKSNMIGFGDVLTEAEILDVLAFIKSTWPKDVIEIHNTVNARSLGSN